jgi:H+/Cl- antiporter ClcA
MRHIGVLLAAAVLTGIGQLLLKHLSSGNGIDTTAAIWFHAGRMPALRTLASAVLSVIIVGLGVSLGREGAPKQAGAVFANFFSDKGRLSDEQRRLLVACGVLEWVPLTEFPWAVHSLHWKSCVESWRSVLSFPPFLRR